MRRLLAVLLLFLAASAFGEELTVVRSKTYSLGTDTVAAKKFIDTTFSAPIDISQFHNMWFQVEYDTRPFLRDTDFVADSATYGLQTSNDRINWTNYGTSLGVIPLKSADLDSIFNSTLKINRDSTITGNYMRLRVIYWDSLEANAPSLINTTYGKVYRVWVITTR